ncbi:MAG: DUF4258 domain-containing protein [Ferruginibacter sp.]|nr:DUF4258 domain-containing protein [Ferruginibacter sp.]
MVKKYLPFILLAVAAILFYWVKTHQRGAARRVPVNTEIPAATPEKQVVVNEPFDRDIKNIIYTKHARCRMACRHIDESEVKEILKDGEINYSKIEEDSKGKTYPVEAVTHDKQHVRIVVAPHSNELVVVTVIDLDTEWQCNCK